MAVPSIITGIGIAALVPLSPCLIFGWGPFPQLGTSELIPGPYGPRPGNVAEPCTASD